MRQTFPVSHYFHARPLNQLADEFRDVLAARGNTAKHVADTRTRIDRMLMLGSIKTLRSLTRRRVELGLGQLRGIRSACTCWHHLRAIKSFSRWLLEEGDILRDLLARIPMPNLDVDLRHPRRVLTSGELAQLLEATAAGPQRYGMAPAARVMLYQLALNSGLRSSELRSLTIAAIDLRGQPATVLVHARSAKNRRTTRQPISRAVAAKLAAYIAGADACRPVFLMPCACSVVRMLRGDLRAARLAYRTAAGIADFHSLRHTFITRLVEIGTDLPTVQKLARHSSITLTMRYVNLDSAVAAAALEKLSRHGRGRIRTYEGRAIRFTVCAPARLGKRRKAARSKLT